MKLSPGSAFLIVSFTVTGCIPDATRKAARQGSRVLTERVEVLASALPGSITGKPEFLRTWKSLP